MTLINKVSNKVATEFRDFFNPPLKKLFECNISAKAKLYEPYNLSNVTVGDGTYISSNCGMSMTTVKKYCSIGPYLSCGWGIHPLNGVSTAPMFYSTGKQNGRTLVTSNAFEERKEVVIGNDVFIGRNVIILDGVTIGDGAVIGAGAVVSKNIPAYAVAVGTPIKVIKYRFAPDIIEQLLLLQWWNQDEEVLKKVAEYNFDIHAFLREMQKSA